MKNTEKKPTAANEGGAEQNTAAGEKRRRALGKIKRALPWVLATLAASVLLLTVYEIAIRALWQPMYWIYYAALALLAIGYTVYNRGFSRTRVSRNELPRSWSEEEKDEFFADAARRKKRSRPMLVFIVALLLVFAYDTVALFFGDFLTYVFPFLELAR